MKTKIEILEEKFNLNYPKTLKIVEYALEDAIKYNKTWTMTAVPMSELSDNAEIQKTQVNEIKEVILSKGFFRAITIYPGQFYDGTDYIKCWNILVFFTESAYDTFQRVSERVLEHRRNGNRSFDTEAPLRDYYDFSPYTGKVNIEENSYTEELSKYGTLMTVEEFLESVADGGFIDYDGWGNPVKDNKMMKVSIAPSEVETMPKDATHFMWYNR